ncbi:hypothetical protein [Streptomyces sp. NPDC020983]|uniref:hypothetical protein n=1 Tax=Streptomyces sp. NPDC020983 TaxID=3365106 RepID=UPI0037BC8539
MPPSAPQRPVYVPPQFPHGGDGRVAVPPGGTWGGDVAPVPAYAPPPAGVRPVAATRRHLAIAVCLVLGLGLIGGAVAGAVLDRGPQAAPAAAPGSAAEFAQARLVWRDAPVDTLFPPVVHGKGAGPGGADRTWTRIGVAAPGGCAGAFDPLLDRVLAPTGCAKLLRATYADSTSTTVTTVGVLVTAGDAAGMSALGRRWTAEHLGGRTDLIPRPVAFPGTAAARFGTAQRGSWDVRVSTALPFVVYAVSGFADGRAVPQPQPASAATAAGATTAAAQVGLGFDATGLAKAIDGGLKAAVDRELHPDARTTPATPAGTEHSR